MAAVQVLSFMLILIATFTSSQKAGSDVVEREKRSEDPLGPMSHVITAIFVGADVDENEALDEEEFWTTFSRFDKNRNGEISRREYVRTLTHRQSPFVALLGSRRLVTKYARRMFAAGDMNKDGVLSRDDAAVIHANLDRNGDGTISMEEYQARWVQILRRIGLTPPQ